MKHQLIVFIALLLILTPLVARNTSFTATFMPPQVWVNSFNFTSFDPTRPDLQPMLTTLSITHVDAGEARVRLKVEVRWNDVTITQAEFITVESIGAIPVTFQNSELVSENAGGRFTKVSGGEFSLKQILNHESLKSALQSGYFPDGMLKIRVSLSSNLESPSYGNPVDFIINVRNADVIHLITPGTSIGGVPPMESIKPINFTWNAIRSGFNLVWLQIREFSPIQPPTTGNVSHTGKLFYETPNKEEAKRLAEGINFADFLPFNEEHYYAWQITMDKYDESNPHVKGEERPPSQRYGDFPKGSTAQSNWFVFKYVSDSNIAHNIDEIQAFLHLLDHPLINSIITSGYRPTGIINSNGYNFTGNEVIQILEAIPQEEMTIRITE
ncbi:MAG: hypothetical protein LHW44_06595 [Candidatus Cloacimonetes bacterium]|nr:hypothetical protein [Candidatus Cloacimonadota bacterium]